MGPQRGGPVKWRRSPRALIAAAIAIVEKKKLAAAGLAPIKPVKFRRSPREIIAAAKVIIEKQKMAHCRKAFGQVHVWRFDSCGQDFTLESTSFSTT